MGSRLYIALNNIVGEPDIEVTLRTERFEDGGLAATALVTFTRLGASYGMDVYTTSSGAELSLDFNFFRPPEEHSEFMRALFEHSIPFRVMH